jgi:ABC-type phosphate transport system substrate-binding protein
MLTSKTKKALALGLAATALGAGLMTGSASADPAQLNALVGVGSDTTQDVMNALSGRSNGILFTPLMSSAATGGRQIISFDATAATAGAGDNCITTKTGAPSFTRPNGSTGGRRALSRAIDGTKYGSAECGGVKDVAGLVDFARSSSGPSSGDTGTDLTYIPFGRDGMSFAYYRKNGAPVTSLTRAQLTSLFTTGPQTIDGVRIVPCGIQTNSGTFQFWNTVTTATTTQENTATTLCNNLLGSGVRAQESDGPALAARGDALALVAGEENSQVVIGFSAGQFIARSNGKASPAPGAGVGIGSISNNGSGANLGSPITGTAPNLAPSSTFFNDTVFGRRVYNVFPTAVINGPGNADLKNLFVDTDATAGNNAVICNAPYTTTVQELGFLSSSDCGSTTLKGSLISGQL